MEGTWCALVDACELGYQWNLYEFDNDLSIRKRIDLIIQDPDLAAHPAIEHLRRVTHEIDERFRTLVKPGATIRSGDDPWWRRCVLQYAGREYAEDVRRLYGIDIDVR
jgi:hypothetical protein